MSRKTEKLYSGITNIDDKMIENAQKNYESTKKPLKWLPWAGVAAAACVGLAVGIPTIANVKETRSMANGTPDTSETKEITTPDDQPAAVIAKMIASPTYPEMAQYPTEDLLEEMGSWEEYDKIYDEWVDKVWRLRKQPEGYDDGTDGFFRNSIQQLLTESGSENRVYSPLSLFMALSMSAEITGGNTRQQILDLLGQDSIESLRSHANSIWQANYVDDGMAKCVLANSIWLNNNITYSQETINRLAIDYYSSSFVGEPGSEEYDKLLQGWLNEQTDGMLENYVSDIKLNPQTVIALASTVDYAGKWNYKFNKDNTESGTFHSPNGDITCDFMNKISDMNYYWSDKYAALSLELENNGSMRLILPDEGITPEDLLNDKKTMDFLMAKQVWQKFDNKYVEVTLSVPKFDVSSSAELSEQLKSLGITDAFDAGISDFSPLTDGTSDGITISEVTHAARVEIDEEGCRASALTVMSEDGAAMPDGHADFILDRPFIFEIMSETGLPLFVGIVNNPAQ